VSSLTVLSLCSGIGGLDLGLERAGMRIVAMCEIDPYARSILFKHWPNIPIYEDVYKLQGKDLPAVDVIAGGFPCQDISYANQKATGLDGERSGPIFYEIMRLCREIRPKYIILENVAALLRRGFNRVLSELHVCGYDAEWDIISAASVGALHPRNRIFIIGIRRDSSDPDCCGLFPGQIREFSTERGIETQFEFIKSGSNVPYTTCKGGQCGEAGNERFYSQFEKGLSGRGDSRSYYFREPSQVFSREPARSDYWLSEPSVGRLVDGIPNRLDRLRCLGNAVVPQVGEHIGRLLVEYDGV